MFENVQMKLIETYLPLDALARAAERKGRAPALPLTGKAAFQAARSRRAPIENW